MTRKSTNAPKFNLPPPGQRIMSLPQLDEARLKAESNFAPYVPAPPAIAANRGGRPTSYRLEFCQVVLDQAALGHTIGATAALIGVTRSTILDWADRFPEFAEAVALAKGARQRFYEGHLIDIVRRGGDSTRFSAVKLGLINVGAEDWREKLGSDTNVTITLASLITESLKPDYASNTVTIEHEPIAETND